jgi:cytochrome P450
MTTIEQSLVAWGDFDRDNPFPLFAAVRGRGPVHEVTLADGHDAWLIVGHTEAKMALNDPRISKDMHAALERSAGVAAEGLPGPAFARHMLAVDPPDHTRLRRLVAAAFSVRRVERLRPEIERIVSSMLDEIAARDPGTVVDLVDAFAFPLPFTVVCQLLGVPEPGRATFGRSLREMLVPTRTPEEYAAAKRASDHVVATLADLVVLKRNEPDDALVSALISARDGDDHLTDQELHSTILQLIIAGHDTTASLIGNAIVAFLLHPEQLARLIADPTLIADAIEEVMRYDAPVPHSTFRYALEDIEIGGTVITSGAQIIVSLAAANRDDSHYTQPDELDIERGDRRHLAFGHGLHFCLGAPLARMESQIAVGAVFRRFPEMRLAVAVDALHWDHGDGLVLRGLTTLPVTTGEAATDVG